MSLCIVCQNTVDIEHGGTAILQRVEGDPLHIPDGKDRISLTIDDFSRGLAPTICNNAGVNCEAFLLCRTRKRIVGILNNK